MNKKNIKIEAVCKPSQLKSRVTFKDQNPNTMKKLLLLLFLAVMAMGTKAQNACTFTYSFTGAFAAVQFNPAIAWPGPVYSYQWDFGDGGVSTLPAPLHTYNGTGPYTVCCTVFDSTGIFCNYCTAVILNSSSCSWTLNLDTATGNATFVAASQSGTISNWDFGDGTSGTGDVVSHTYVAPGVYNICLTQVDSASGIILCTNCQTLSYQPNSSSCTFSSSSSPASPNNIIFVANVNNGSSFTWDYGDGSVGTGGPTNTHVYNSAGTYVVCLTVTDFLGNSCQYCSSVTVPPLSNNCYFTATPDTLLTVQFVGSGSQSGTALSWDYGDGSVASGSTTYHVYSLPGTYNVCMTESNSAGTPICSFCQLVTVSGNSGNCAYTYMLDSTNAYTINVAAITTIVGSTVMWDFGDNSTGTGVTATHTYNAPGQYNVCMSETDLLGTVLCQSCMNVSITGNPAGNCSFMYSPDPMNQGMINFIAMPASGGSTVSWSFGDGTSGSGFNPSHTYVTAGTYTVCMNEIDPNGTIVCTSCSSVVVSSNANCSFTTSIDSVQANLVYFNFTPNSFNSQVMWDFGDGSAGMGANTQHYYPQPGVYNACVTEINQSTGVTICYTCQVITVNFVQSCSFTAVPDPADPNTLTLTGVVGAGNIASWDFGDGTVGTGSPIQHTYAQPGIYHICVYEVDTLPLTTLCISCQDIAVGSVLPACRANFVATSLGLTGYFIDLSTGTGPATSYSWDFGDGTTSSSRFPQHVYATPGSYTACLTIADNNCTDQFCIPVVVDTTIGTPGSCQAYFVTLQLAPYQIAVVNLSSGVNLNFAWDFGDGTTANVPYPSHFYNSIGTYNLCLTIDDGAGCNQTYCDTVSVDSLGNIFRGMNGFTVNVLSPAQLTGISDSPDATPFTAYPNPVQSSLTIALPATVNSEVNFRIFNLQGAEVSHGTLNSGIAKLNVSDWQAGIYLLEVTDNAGYKSYRQIIKQ